LSTLGSSQLGAVLALFVLHRNEVVSIDRLVDDVWVGATPRSARTQLHGHVSRLRRLLGSANAGVPYGIETVAGGYLLRLPATTLDLDGFHCDIAEARNLITAREYGLASQCFRSALNRWHGPPFFGVGLDSVRQAAEHLDDLRRTVVEDLADAELRLNRWDAVIETLSGALAANPYRERPRTQLMTALSAAGRRAEALEVYRGYRRVLVSDLGIEPSDELRTLHQGILRGSTVW
jgi:DNA-binding SARP family transcriptional activator